MSRWTTLPEAAAAELSRKNQGAWSRKTTSAKTNAILDASTKREKRPRKAAVPVPSESWEQSEVVRWFDAVARDYRLDPHLLMAIPNGAHKSFSQAAKFKQEGLRAGAPDLLLAVPRIDMTVRYGLFLEMKRSNWKPPRIGTKAYEKYQVQESFHEMLRAQGYRVQFCAGHNEAINAIKEYLT